MKIFYLNNRLEEWESDFTIQDLLDKKSYSFRMLVVKIDGRLIKRENYGTAVIPQDSEVQVLHLMSGG